MARGGLPALAALTVGDHPAAWAAMGFALTSEGSCAIGGVHLDLAGAQDGAGLLGWGLRASMRLPASLDGIPTTTLDPESAPAPDLVHPNGARAVDHVVLATPDLSRTLGALEAAGMEVRRVREVTEDLHQAFLWAGEVIVEVAGPPRTGDEGPARLWGLTLVAADLESFEALPGRPFGESRDAIQPGRRIVTSGPRAGTSVRLAVLTPHRRAG
jgi:hypothetical protein